ncbi:hypothetical protein Pcac1_g29478 [Phytophthora cactorum]|nr:hypothetical protein Pcac1_g29478 [Phytophthora cactorum]
MMVPARRSTRRQKRKSRPMTKMKLPEDPQLCVIGLDWKKQVRGFLFLSAPRQDPQTKKKKHGDEDDDSTPQCLGSCKLPMPLKQATCRSHDIPRSGERPRPSALAQGDSC